MSVAAAVVGVVWGLLALSLHTQHGVGALGMRLCSLPRIYHPWFVDACVQPELASA